MRPRDSEEAAFGTYASAGGQQLVYRVKTGGEWMSHVYLPYCCVLCFYIVDEHFCFYLDHMYSE